MLFTNRLSDGIVVSFYKKGLRRPRVKSLALYGTQRSERAPFGTEWRHSKALSGSSGGKGGTEVPTLLRTRQSMCSDELVRFADYLAQAKKGDVATLGNLLEGYRNYLALLARAADRPCTARENGSGRFGTSTFLEAHRDFPHFRGQSEGELVGARSGDFVRNLANALRHYFGTQGRDIRLERELSAEIDQSSQVLDRGLIRPLAHLASKPPTPSKLFCWPMRWAPARGLSRSDHFPPPGRLDLSGSCRAIRRRSTAWKSSGPGIGSTERNVKGSRHETEFAA